LIPSADTSSHGGPRQFLGCSAVSAAGIECCNPTEAGADHIAKPGHWSCASPVWQRVQFVLSVAGEPGLAWLVFHETWRPARCQLPPGARSAPHQASPVGLMTAEGMSITSRGFLYRLRATDAPRLRVPEHCVQKVGRKRNSPILDARNRHSFQPCIRAGLHQFSALLDGWTTCRQQVGRGRLPPRDEEWVASLPSDACTASLGRQPMPRIPDGGSVRSRRVVAPRVGRISGMRRHAGDSGSHFLSGDALRKRAVHQDDCGSRLTSPGRCRCGKH